MSDISSKEQIRNRLVEIWRKTPAWIASADVRSVREYKKSFMSITKVINNKSASLLQLQAAENTTNLIYERT